MMTPKRSDPSVERTISAFQVCSLPTDQPRHAPTVARFGFVSRSSYPMKLRDVISQLPGVDRDATLFIAPNVPIAADMQAAVGHISDDDTLPPEADGLRVFLDVWHVREVLDGKATLAGLSSPPSIEQQIKFLREYAENGC